MIPRALLLNAFLCGLFIVLMCNHISAGEAGMAAVNAILAACNGVVAVIAWLTANDGEARS